MHPTHSLILVPLVVLLSLPAQGAVKWHRACLAELAAVSSRSAQRTIQAFSTHTFPEALRRDLPDLVSFPSVSGEASGASGLEKARLHVEEKLRGLQFEVGSETDEGLPLVFARSVPDPNKPTVLFYGHFDVVSVANQTWKSDPFQLTLRDGRYYGRGAADNKGPLAMIFAVLHAFQAADGKLPVNVVVLLDGGEEEGRSLQSHLDRHKKWYRGTDAVLICDGTNVVLSRGAIEIGSRGYLSIEARVKTAERSVHSGSYGGAIPSASVALTRLLGTLHQPDQSVAVAALNALLKPVPEPLQYVVGPDELRAVAGLSPQVPFVGHAENPFPNVARGTAISYELKPTGTSQVSHEAVATLAVRLGPGMKADEAFRAVESHLREQMKGLPGTLTVSMGRAVPYNRFDPNHPLLAQVATRAMATAYQQPPIFTEDGGTTPLFSQLQNALGSVPVLFYGASDPQSNWHAANESVDPEMLRKAGVATIEVLKAIGDLK